MQGAPPSVPPAGSRGGGGIGRRRLLSMLLVGAAASLPGRPVAAAGPAAVLVAGLGASLGELDNRDIRKLYLGYSLERNGLVLEPVINRTDPRLYEEFLQKVLFMSDGHYRRQVVSRVFRTGGRRPIEVESVEQLVQVLEEQPGRLSFLWSHRADPDRMRVLGGLW